jgi:hypothetical protein
METQLSSTHDTSRDPLLCDGNIEPDYDSTLSNILREAESNYATLQTNDQSFFGESIARMEQTPDVSFLTVLLGSFIVTQLGFLWGSFLSHPWILLKCSVSTAFSSVPTDITLKTIDLGTIVSTFISIGSMVSVIILGLTTVIIPFCMMIINPVLVYERHIAIALNLPIKPISYQNTFCRFSFLVFYIFLIMDIAVSSIKLKFLETSFIFQCFMGSGMIYYFAGMTLSLTSIMLLTLDQRPETRFNTPVTLNYHMRILEEHEDDLRDRRSEFDASIANRLDKKIFGISGRLIVFEISCLALILWIASFSLPLFEISYHGVASGFLSTVTQTTKIVDLLHVPNGPAKMLLQITLLFQVFILPGAAYILAVGVLFFRYNKRFLNSIQTGVNGISLCLGILIIIPQLKGMSVSLLNDSLSRFCLEFESLVGDSCINMTGKVGAGTWCFLVQSLLLEILISWTLRFA